MCERNNSVLGTKKTIRKAWLLFSITLFLVFFSFGHYASAITVVPYDNFYSGYIDTTTKWGLKDDSGFFSVIPSPVPPPQPYVLQASGSGGASFPGARLTTLPSYHSFSGYFGAGINFFNFSESGYTPGSGSTEPYPSINLMIGDWAGGGAGPSNNYFLVSRSVSPSGGAIGWREYDKDNNLLGHAGTSYTGDKGGLMLDYNSTTGTLELGYFTSPNPSGWGTATPTIIKTFSGVSFSGDPRLRISFTPGGGGALSVDVGGLYYADLSNRAVPLPSSLLLLGPGLVGLLALKRRFKK